MKKIFTLFLFVIATMVFVAGCSQSTNSKANTISFPASDYGKTEFNASVYAIEPFLLSLNLPDNWSVEERKSEGEFDLLSVFSKYNIRNEDNVLVGVVGYNIYEPYENSIDDPCSIYSQIALGNNYQFNVRDTYDIISETENGVTAMVDVFYSASVNNGEEKHNNGIVSYNKDLLVYVAFEFNSEKITDEQIRDVAKSILIKQ